MDFYHATKANLNVNDILDAKYKGNIPIIKEMIKYLNVKGMEAFFKQSKEAFIKLDNNPIHIRNTSETIMEYYRCKNHPTSRSRIESIFAFDNIEQAQKFNVKWLNSEASIYLVSTDSYDKVNYSFFNIICGLVEDFLKGQQIYNKQLEDDLEQWTYCYYCQVNNESDEYVEYLCDNKSAYVIRKMI